MDAPAVTAQPSGTGPAGRLLAVNVTVCILLLIQYLLGMAVNLYVAIPGRHPGAGARGYFTGVVTGLAWVIPHGPAWAAAHAAFGLALVLAACATIALTWRQGSRLATVTSSLGALAILGAGFNGASFLNYGHAFSSMLMAGLWALALVCYITGVLLAARRLPMQPEAGSTRERKAVAATGRRRDNRKGRSAA
jgi:hypothetical protein